MDSSRPVRILTRSGEVFVTEQVTPGLISGQLPGGLWWRVLPVAAITAPPRTACMRTLSGSTGGIPWV